jgi:hypothetical protein
MAEVSIDAMAALLRYCEQFAKQMLAEAGEFHPFGALVNRNGQVEVLAAHLGSEFPQGSELYTFLEGTVRAMASEGKAVAYALAANVTIPAHISAPLPDGVRVHVEAPGYSRLIYTPYRALSYRALRKFLVIFPTVEYTDPIAVDIANKVFSRAEG